MKWSALAKDFEDTFLDLWDGTDWVPFALQGVFQVYDRFITERTFGVKKRIFLSSDQILPEHEIVRTPDGKICLIESAVPDYEDNKRVRASVLLRETNVIATAQTRTRTFNASGVATGTTKAFPIDVWADLDRYNSNMSGEFAGVYHETDILMVPATFTLDLDTPLTVGGVSYKIAEIGRMLRLKEVRIRRAN